jgi:hypothetical protein
MPTARYGLAASAVNSVIYAAGGYAGAAQAVGTVEAYDPASDSWTAIAPMPTPRTYPSVIGVGSVLYSLGGFDAAVVVQVTNEAFAPIPTPAQVVTAIGNMGLPAAVANSLSAPLNNINPSNTTAACGKLDAFINQVNSKAQNGQLTSDQASQLLQAVNAIRASFGC